MRWMISKKALPGITTWTRWKLQKEKKMARKNDSNKDRLEKLRELLVELNLTTIARELSGVLAHAEQSAPGYSDFLYRVLEVEQAARTERKIQRRIRWSKLGPHVSLDDFDFSVRPKISPQAVKELLTCRFVEERRNIILVGRSSLGKTTVAKAIGHAACRLGLSVYFVAMDEMLQGLHASRADGTYRTAFRRVAQPDLLILDDAGFSSFKREAANELFRVVCSRHRQRSTIVVTNLPFKKWGEFLPSPAQAVAIADRLIDQATILRFSGKPFRNPRDIFGAPLDDE
jgi:DNA replication protein DnaC